MKSIQSTLIFLSLLFLCSWGLNNPVSFTISGTIKDATDGSTLPGVTVKIKGQEKGTVTDLNGAYQIEVPSENTVLTYSFIGYKTVEIKVGEKRKFTVLLKPDEAKLEEVVVVGYSTRKKRAVTGAVYEMSPALEVKEAGYHLSQPIYSAHTIDHNTEEYATIHENTFSDALKNSLTTFSIDVDNASYSNMRRYINMGQTPPKDAIRIEEMINYFTYDYPQPEGEAPFSVNTEVSTCPWNTQHQLVHIGLQGKRLLWIKSRLPTWYS